MSSTDKYLDYEGLRTYHSELVKRLKDLDYDPNRIFDDTEALCNRSNWDVDAYGRIYGLKLGLIVTVGSQIWQLVNPETFAALFRTVNPEFSASDATPEELGWKIIGIDFDVDEHTLRLFK